MLYVIPGYDEITVLIVKFVKCKIIDIFVNMYQHLDVSLKDHVSWSSAYMLILIVVQIIR